MGFDTSLLRCSRR